MVAINVGLLILILVRLYFKAVNNPEDKFYQADEDVLEFNERYLDGELYRIFS